MEVTLEGIVTEVKRLHSENAEFPMYFTHDGIVTDVKLVQPENTESLMEVTSLPILTDWIAVIEVELIFSIDSRVNIPSASTGTSLSGVLLL
jgi:hypothetical protein